MDEINRQLQELKLQEQELHKQKLLLQKQQHEEEIKRIEAALNNQEQNVCSSATQSPSADINALTQLLMQQQQRIEQLERGTPAPRVRRTVPKLPPSQRPARQRRRTRERSPSKSPEPVVIPEPSKPVVVPPKPLPTPVAPPVSQPRPEHIVIDFKDFKDDNEIHDKMYSELVEEWTTDDDEKRRINQLMYGELSQADQDKINGDDQLYQQYIAGDYTPDSYTQSATTGHQAAMAEHMRRRMKGTRWRQRESEINDLASAQQHLHKRLWERASPENSEDSDDVVFLPQSRPDAMTDVTREARAADLIFRRHHAE
jgi:hypothetical protein